MDINDNFLSDETTDTSSEATQTELEKIKLGDKEFTQDELLQKVGLADKVSELESKYNTKLDSVWPEYGRSQNKVRELEGKIAQMQTQKAETGEVDPTTAKQAVEAAKKLGILTRDDGVVTRDQFRDMYTQERETEKLLTSLSNYEKDITGDDGRPKFDKIKVLEYMRDTNIKDPMIAYKVMHESQLDQWKMSEVGRVKMRGMYTTRGSNLGNKQPADVKPTKDNLNDLVAQALEGN
jgi:hypothetical protein